MKTDEEIDRSKLSRLSETKVSSPVKKKGVTRIDAKRKVRRQLSGASKVFKGFQSRVDPQKRLRLEGSSVRR